MVGVDFKAVLEVNAVGVGALAADAAVHLHLADALLGGNALHFVEQAAGVATFAAFRQGNQIVDMDVAAADQIGAFAKTAYCHRAVFAGFKNADQAVAFAALHPVYLRDKLLDAADHRPQHAQGGIGGGGVVGGDFAQLAAGIGGFAVRYCLLQRRRTALLLGLQGFAVEHAQVVVGGKIHQKAEHAGIDFLQLGVDDHAADFVQQHGMHPFMVGQAVVFVERRQDAAQTLRPVAGAEHFAVAGGAVDDDGVGMWGGHIFAGRKKSGIIV